MDGLTLIREARAAGLRLAVHGDKLVIRGPRRAESVVRKLIDYKPEVMTALKLRAIDPPAPRTFGPAGDDPTVWRDWIEERCAIRQLDGRLDRVLAARLAWGEAIEAWCDGHPPAIDGTCCAACGKALGADVLDLPDGARVHFEREREFAWVELAGKDGRPVAIETGDVSNLELARRVAFVLERAARASDVSGH